MEAEENGADRAGLGAAIRMLRHACGMSQRALAEGVGLSPSQICLLEAGKRRLPMYTLQRIAKVLGVPAGAADVEALPPDGLQMVHRRHYHRAHALLASELERLEKESMASQGTAAAGGATKE